ncbi:hypothetical protein BDW74DRAFT_186864 [Aspergillus multicolor]|uniref:uncharacterized protein n=1 Tax=Aspergillus multicolor TaxID=41759 RepID=UPI003CCDBF7A
MEPRPLDRKRREQKPRVLLSCTSCREKKLRCDRARPCLNCRRRQQATSCHYIRARLAHSKPAWPARTIGMDGINSPPAESCGAGFVHPSHWRALMDHAVSAFLTRSDNEGKSSGDTVPLLSGLSHTVALRDLIAALPPRHEADRLVSACLESEEPSLIVIHSPTFQHQYHEFWRSPLTVSPAWLALLYGVLACGMWIQRFVGSSTNHDLPEAFHAMRESCAVALSKSDLTVPGRFKVEAALMCLGVEYLRFDDSKTGVSILLGIVSRLAIMMGYHQPGHLCRPPPSPFDAEMRSRAWLLLSVIDHVVASQTGLPRVVYHGLANVSRPRNPLDADLHPTMPALPPSRSASETASRIVYMLAVDDLHQIANEIADLAAQGPISRESTVSLGQQLEAWKAGLPRPLRLPVPEGPAAQPSALVMQRTLEIVYQRSRCILHRQYLVSAPLDPDAKRFRLACVDAARCVLEQQGLLFHEGLHNPRHKRRAWFGTSRTVSDCLTAAMVICVEVITDSGADNPRTSTESTPIAGLINLLHQTYQSLDLTSSPSAETAKAAEIIATMLRRMGKTVSNFTHSDTGPHSPAPHRITISPDARVAESVAPSELTGPSPIWSAFDDFMNAEMDSEVFDWALWDRETRQLNGPCPESW